MTEVPPTLPPSGKPDWPQTTKTPIRAGVVLATGGALFFPFIEIALIGRPGGLDIGWALWVYAALPGLALCALAAPFVAAGRPHEETLDAVVATIAFWLSIVLIVAWVFFLVISAFAFLFLFPFVLPMLAMEAAMEAERGGSGRDWSSEVMTARIGPGGWLLLAGTAMAVALLTRGGAWRRRKD